MRNSVQFVIGASPDIAAALCAAAMSAQLQCLLSCNVRFHGVVMLAALI
jgi:hypothetical protein